MNYRRETAVGESLTWLPHLGRSTLGRTVRADYDILCHFLSIPSVMATPNDHTWPAGRATFACASSSFLPQTSYHFIALGKCCNVTSAPTARSLPAATMFPAFPSVKTCTTRNFTVAPQKRF